MMWEVREIKRECENKQGFFRPNGLFLFLFQDCLLFQRRIEGSVDVIRASVPHTTHTALSRLAAGGSTVDVKLPKMRGAFGA